jgi:hypothetical protein
MDVALLYFDGCPNHGAALTSLQRLLDEAGWVGTVEMVRVETQEEAERVGFRGSPTVLLDGTDPFFEADAPVGLSCRVYKSATGLQRVPPIGDLRYAIAQHLG